MSHTEQAGQSGSNTYNPPRVHDGSIRIVPQAPQPHRLPDPSAGDFRGRNLAPEALIVDFDGRSFVDYELLLRQPPIINLVRDGPNACMNMGDDHTAAKPLLRWIHLPQNNMRWVELLMMRLYAERQGTSAREPPAASEPQPSQSLLEPDLLLADEVWTGRQYNAASNTSKPPYSRFMRPLYSKIATTSIEKFPAMDSTNNFVIYVRTIFFRAIHPPGPSNWICPKSGREYNVEMAMGKDVMPISGRSVSQRNHDQLTSAMPNPNQRGRGTSYDPKSGIHPRRTLDQSYYFTLGESEMRRRDQDQVVSKYSTSVLGMGNPPLMMVDQLWLWVIDTESYLDTVVTCFPKCNSDNPEWMSDNTDVRQRILMALSMKHYEMKDSMSLVYLIVDKCSGVFFPTVREVNEDFQFLEFFAVSIGNLANKQTLAFDHLCNHSRRMGYLQRRRSQLTRASLRDGITDFRDRTKKILRTNQPPIVPIAPIADEAATFRQTNEEESFRKRVESAGMARLDKMIRDEVSQLVEITKETNYLKEIKDIQDEINSIISIFNQQRQVLDSMNRDKSHNKNKQFKILCQQVVDRIEHVQDIEAEATRAYQALRDLLDLKQKQASVSEAHSARQEAEETAQQGRSIMLFTIITIIFVHSTMLLEMVDSADVDQLPLSFIAAVFSMNAREINGTPVRGLQQIWRIMFPTTLAVFLVSICLAFNNTIIWAVGGMIDFVFHKDKTSPLQAQNLGLI